MCRPESTCAPYKELVCDQSSPSSGGCPGNSGGSSRGELQTPTSISAPKPLNKVIKPQIITGERWWCFKALEPQNHCFPNIRTRSANSIVSLASLGFIISETKWLGCLFSNRLFSPNYSFPDIVYQRFIERLLACSMSQLPHVHNGDKNNISLIVLWVFSELISVDLEQFLGHS